MHTRTKGNVAENVSCSFLRRRGFRILARNYQKKWGELDIVAIKDEELHFFEVKSTISGRGTVFRDGHRPEDNVHDLKMRKISSMISTYMAEMGYSMDQKFMFHVLAVALTPGLKKARIKWIMNVIL